MTRRIATLVLALLVLALVAAQGANAASSSAIHRDAADGSIDGDYTLQEMRAADRTVPAEIREYYGWEDAYSAYLRRLSNPDAPPVVVPVDSNRDGNIDERELDVAQEKAEDIGGVVDSSGSGSDSILDDEELEECETENVAPECADSRLENRDDDNEPIRDSGRDDDDGGSWLIWLIVGLPVLIVAFGAYRMARRGTPADGALPKEERPSRRARRAKGRGDQDPRDL